MAHSIDAANGKAITRAIARAGSKREYNRLVALEQKSKPTRREQRRKASQQGLERMQQRRGGYVAGKGRDPGCDW